MTETKREGPKKIEFVLDNVKVTEVWQKTEMFCPNCGKKGLWQEVEEIATKAIICTFCITYFFFQQMMDRKRPILQKQVKELKRKTE